MDKESLPKLEIDGFTNEAKKPEPVVYRSWKTKAADLAQKIGIPVKDAKEKKINIDKPGTQEVDIGYRRLLIKTGICAAIAVIILGIASINSPVTDTITDTISDALNHELDIDEDIGRLKFVQNLSDETQGVFSTLSDTAAVYPVEGQVITTFGQAGSKGVRFEPAGTQINSMAKGTVEYIGIINDSGYIKVKLDSGETAVYYNISPSVEVDDIVMPGQEIGSLDGDYLYVEIKDGDVYVDPVVYIETWTAPVEE